MVQNNQCMQKNTNLKRRLNMQKCNLINVRQSPIKTDCPNECNGTHCVNCPLTNKAE